MTSEPLHRVLLVSDEEAGVSLLRTGLEREGYSVQGTGFDGFRQLPGARPDLVLLDLEVPHREGARLVRELRSWSNMPVIVLSPRGRQEEVIEFLDAGADDCLTAPFGMGQLIARMKVAVRRKAAEPSHPVFSCGDLLVDFDRRQVSVKGSLVRLTPSEYSILSVLAQNQGRTVTYAQLQRQLWGNSEDARRRRLHVRVALIRRKIEQDPSRPKLICTEPDTGYRLGLGCFAREGFL